MCQNSPYSNLLREGHKVHLIRPRDYGRPSGTTVIVKAKKRVRKRRTRVSK